MYVCVCNAITDHQIREAAQTGVEDLWGLQAALGVATNCGSCRETASEILTECRAQNRRAEPERYVPATA